MVETIPNRITIGEDSLSIDRIHQAFMTIPEGGEILDEELRFKDYKPNNTTNAEWISILGLDVNNAEHMPITHAVARAFLRLNENPPMQYWTKEIPKEAVFTQEEKADLLFSALIHDWGEAKTKDVTFDKKTAEKEKKEAKEFSEISKLVLHASKNYGFIDTDEDRAPLGAVIQRLKNEIIFKQKNTPETTIHKAFATIEGIGYMRTALRAWREQFKQQDQDVQNGLNWLTSNVFGNQISLLLERAQIYPAVKIFLVENHAIISDALQNLPSSVFENYADADKEKNKEKYTKAIDTWAGWIHELESEENQAA